MKAINQTCGVVFETGVSLLTETLIVFQRITLMQHDEFSLEVLSRLSLINSKLEITSASHRSQICNKLSWYVFLQTYPRITWRHYSDAASSLERIKSLTIRCSSTACLDKQQRNHNKHAFLMEMHWSKVDFCHRGTVMRHVITSSWELY